MPKIHKYKNKAGFYIKSTVKGRITTYQVTENGYNYLVSKRYKDKDDISINFLMKLKELNYVFTNGEGSGNIEPKQIYNIKNNYKNPYRNKTLAQIESNEIGCLLVIILIIILCFILFS